MSRQRQSMSGEGEEGSFSGKRDFAWKYASPALDPKSLYFHCKFCGQKCTGGINRLKHHLAGTSHGMKPCPKVTAVAKQECIAALSNFKEVKAKRNEVLEEIGYGFGGDDDGSFGLDKSGNVIHGSGCGCGSGRGRGSSNPKTKGPMDKFTTSEARQSTLNSKWKKEERKEVCKKIGRFVFSAGLPFNVVNDPYWKPAVEAIGKYGIGLVPPSMHELRTWVLKSEVDEINKGLEEHKQSWKEFGCSIMSDGWTDGRSRCLLNFLVNSPAGTWFLKSVDASDTIKNGELMFKYLDNVIDEVGEENVVQVITDNASNYVNAGKRLMEKRKKLYWTPCAAHCIDLMLEDIGKLKIHQDTVQKAKEVVKYIYGHSWVLALMRTFTHNCELIRPAVTRFATSFLTLRSIYKQKEALRAMFNSEKWCTSNWAKQVEAVKVRAIVEFDPDFWGNVAYCIKSTIPLVNVLREVDSEVRPPMGFIYELMDSAKEKIALNLGNNKKSTMQFGTKLMQDGVRSYINHCMLQDTS